MNGIYLQQCITIQRKFAVQVSVPTQTQEEKTKIFRYTTKVRHWKAFRDKLIKVITPCLSQTNDVL